MGDSLKKIDSQSQIYKKGMFVDFPLTPLNLMSKIGIKNFIKSAFQISVQGLKSKKANISFEDIALKAYGKHIAEEFLLNYSEKLWGLPCSQLSPQIAGKRLKGLNLKTFLIEGLLGIKAKTKHIDGAFYYPDYGIGSVFDKIGDICGSENIKTNHRVTKIYHKNNKITDIELNNIERIRVENLMNTLPLSIILNILEPAPPQNILNLVKKIRFRNILLIILIINKPSINNNATMYFPNSQFPFTRIYEPKNRSSTMAPTNQTTLAIEIPCQKDDFWWELENDDITEKVKRQVLELNFFKESELLDTTIKRLPFAYPILEIGFEKKVNKILDYLEGFENLHTNGRNGVFKYSHIHDMFLTGKDIISSLH
jgi:protoporphyrinogen oxidase